MPMRLGAAQIDEFDRRGYLFLPQAFSPAENALPKQAAGAVYGLERDEARREKSHAAPSGDLRTA